jgi:hypothetical protein
VHVAIEKNFTLIERTKEGRERFRLQGRNKERKRQIERQAM